MCSDVPESTLSAFPSRVQPGQEIFVSYSGAPGNIGDRIAMYVMFAPIEDYTDTLSIPAGTSDGSLTFIAPSLEDTYKFRLLPGFGPTDIARSQPVQVEGGGVSADDHGNTFASATSITFGSTRGAIEDAPDIDFFSFFARAGLLYTAEIDLDTHADSILTLYDENGSWVAENDDADGLGLGSRISLTPPRSGEYFLAVRSYDSEDHEGSYTLMLSEQEVPPDDHGNTFPTATLIFPGTTRGATEVANDLDFFRFFVPRGATIAGEVHLDTHTDTILTLYDPSESYLDEDDDASDLSGGSRITQEAEQSGEYYFVVKSYDQGSDVGTYRLILTIEPLTVFEPTTVPLPDDHGDSFAMATDISQGTTFGTISPPSDIDYFRFFLLPGVSYTGEVYLETHPDTLLALFDASGADLDFTDDASGLGRGSRISGTATGGDYYFAVALYDDVNDTGTYRLVLTNRAAGADGDTGADAVRRA